MEISPVSGSITAQATPEATTSNALSSDFETFLKMLTAQLKNQDPLNPVESDDYAVQLATFSSVEQQVLTNDLLKSLTAAFTGGGLGTYASWVGMEVRTAAPVAFNGESVTLLPSVASAADRADIVISDSAGNQVARLPAPLDGESFTWDGTDSSGVAVLPGAYSYQTESYLADELIETAAGEIYAKVIEAQTIGGVPTLVLAGGFQVSVDDVSAIRSTPDDA